MWWVELVGEVKWWVGVEPVDCVIDRLVLGVVEVEAFVVCQVEWR